VDGALVIDADFGIHAQGVNPLHVLSEVTTSIGGLLAGSVANSTVLSALLAIHSTWQNNCSTVTQQTKELLCLWMST
jgi:hypothetical protein